MVKESDERTELMILKSSDFYRNFNHILYKYCYTTGETAGSPLTYTSVML